MAGPCLFHRNCSSGMCLFTGNVSYFPSCLTALLIPLLSIGLTSASHCCSSCSNHMRLLASSGDPLLRFTNRYCKPAIASRRYRCNSEAEHWPIPKRKRNHHLSELALKQTAALWNKIGPCLYAAIEVVQLTLAFDRCLTGRGLRLSLTRKPSPLAMALCVQFVRRARQT